MLDALVRPLAPPSENLIEEDGASTVKSPAGAAHKDGQPTAGDLPLFVSRIPTFVPDHKVIAHA
jgi:hypothetical protein